MSGVIAWAVFHARMIVALILLSAIGGAAAYVGLPKEGSPNIDIPVLYVSAPLPGVSAEDAERLLVKPLENKLRGVEGLDEMESVAAENHGGIVLKFDFDWDKAETLAEVRALVDEARSELPADAEEPKIGEVNLSAFPIIVVSLSGDVPRRTLQRLGAELQRELEALTPVLEVGFAGELEEMVEVVVDPLQLESYDVTAQELLAVVSANNRLIAAGAVEGETGRFSVRVPGNFQTVEQILGTPVRVAGDRVVTIGDIATIRRAFEDPEGTARHNGEPTVALQVKKRLGENIVDTVELVKAKAAEVAATWPAPLRQAVDVGFSLDESRQVKDMVAQLEGSVTLAVLLVMLVVVLALGFRSALLVGLTIPLSFLLAFALLALFGMSVNNMVMFGLILAVGMLVDGAIVVSEYADRRLREGQGPRRAYAEAAQRMLWPITASTATTLCAFLPMLFWPGMPGQFMEHLPITLIFVLSASLVVALIFLPVLGAAIGRVTATLGRGARGAFALVGLRPRRRLPPVERSHRRTPFGRAMALIVRNPLGPFLAIGAAVAGMAAVFSLYSEHGNGVEFFIDTEPERAIVHVRARGNLSLAEKDRLVLAVEEKVAGVEGVETIFGFAGESGMEQQGAEGPKDAVGQLMIELAPWGTRPDGDLVLAQVEARAAEVPGVIVEVMEAQEGPQQGKPLQLRLEGRDWGRLLAAAGEARARFERVEGLVDIGDTRPLPGIDWEVTVDREAAGRFGADIETTGTLIQLITRGALLDTIRPPDTDEELEIRVRFPEDQRTLTTLEEMKVRTPNGLVPIRNFIDIEPVPALAEISRIDGVRFVVVEADVAPGVNANEKIAEIQAALDAEPVAGVRAVWQGDQEEQAEAQAFLMKAFAGALGLMFAILLAQFNSVYNSILVLSAVVMSVTGVLIGMMVMGQPFSIIMTGVGIVALAGIVVNNNIVLIDTYQEFSATLPPLEAILRTAEQRIRPVLLTTVTTMAGLLPMVFAAGIEFARLGEGAAALLAAGAFTAAGWTGLYETVVTLGAPAALWWTQLSTAVVFGLGVATVLTLVVTPAALAARVWFWRGVGWLGSRRGRAARDRALRRAARRRRPEDIVWNEPEPPAPYVLRYPEAAE